MKYNYFNPIKLEEATKTANNRIVSMKSAIASKKALLATAEKEQAEIIKREIKSLEEKSDNLDELVLEEYLNLCGRVEDENGQKILTRCDKVLGNDKIDYNEMNRRSKITQAKNKKKAEK